MTKPGQFLMSSPDQFLMSFDMVVAVEPEHGRDLLGRRPFGDGLPTRRSRSPSAPSARQRGRRRKVRSLIPSTSAASACVRSPLVPVQQLLEPHQRISSNTRARPIFTPPSPRGGIEKTGHVARPT
jgi:hypothetical protein